MREALGIRERLLGEAHPLVAESLLSLGECLYLQSRTKEAEPVLRRAVAISQPDSDTQAGAKNFLALVIEKRGATDEAAQLLRSASDGLRHTQGADSPDYLTSMHNLAGALRDLGDLNGAEATERDALETRLRVDGPDHPHTTFSLNMLGWILLEKGDWSAAEPYLKQAYEANRKRLGDRHPRLAVSLNHLGQVYEEKGDYASAAHFAEEALKTQRKLGGANNPDAATSLIGLGLAHFLIHDSAGAEAPLREAVDIRKQSFPSGHLQIIAVQIRLGDVLVSEGKTAEAEPLLRAASMAAHHSPFPLPPWPVAEADNALGACLVRMGRKSEAIPLLR